MTIFMTNMFTGETKPAPEGFSWTTLFFGFFVPLTRGDMMWGAIMFVAQLCTSGLASIAFAFFYNSLYRDRLLARGFRVAGGLGGPLGLGRFEPTPPQQIIQQVYVNSGPDGTFHTGIVPPPPPYQPTPDPYAYRAPERDVYHEAPAPRPTPAATPAAEPSPPPPVVDNRYPPRPTFGKRGL